MPIKSNPRRLPRRNHYQEGPGFLFVATQGGWSANVEVQRSAATGVRVRARAVGPCSAGGLALSVADSQTASTARASAITAICRRGTSRPSSASGC
jgi:hypothetical protein